MISTCMALYARNGNIYKPIVADVMPINYQNVAKSLKVPITPITAHINTTYAHTTEMTNFADTAVRKAKRCAVQNVLVTRTIKKQIEKQTAIISNAAYRRHHPKTVKTASMRLVNANVQQNARTAAMRTVRASLWKIVNMASMRLVDANARTNA